MATLKVRRSDSEAVTVYRSSDLLDGDAVFNTPRAGAFAVPVAADDWIEWGGYRYVIVSAFTDAASAASGCVIEHSMNGTDVHLTDALTDEDGNLTVGASKSVSGIVDKKLRYWRFSWTNGSGAQTEFEVEVEMYRE